MADMKLQEELFDDDDELLLLEKFLSEDNGNADTTKTVKTETLPENVKTKKVPRLVEDDTFAKAFSYDIPAVVYEKPIQIEEIDSSDEEEMSNFLERKYNEYGRELNEKLKQKRQAKHESKVESHVSAIIGQQSKETKITETITEQPIVATTTPTAEIKIKNLHKPIERKAHPSTYFKQIVPQEQALQSQLPPLRVLEKPIYTDPIFGFRLVNPLISSTLLVERMSGRRAISFADLAVFTQQGDVSKDWVIAGVLLNKSPVRQTKTGQPFSVWSLSDLRNDIKKVSLFLFKGAHKDLWKTAEGMCIAVLNPSIFEKRSERGDVASLSIDTSQKMMILGQSKDMGVCKARKKNGDPCTSVVNTHDCEYCVFHMQQEYSKMSRRSEFQSQSLGRGINELRNKVLGKSEVFYGGQSFMAIPAKKSSKLLTKDRERMSTLSEYAHSPFAGSVNHSSNRGTHSMEPVPYAQRNTAVTKTAAIVDSSGKQRLKDLELLKTLQTHEHQKSAENNSPNKSGKSPSDLGSSSLTSMPPPPPDEKYRNREFSFGANTPRLSREDFSLEVNIGTKKSLLAKQRAADLIKKSPISKANPNATRGSLDGKRRAIDELNELFTSPAAKRQRLEEEQRANERKSRLARIMEATSSHRNLIDMREQQEQDEYFNKLEKKEALEEKMLNTYKIPCKAVICQKCKYTAFSAAQRCKDERHQLKVVDAVKRFFQCKDCSNRVASVFKLPKISCKNCKGSRWERAAMIRDRKVCNGSEQLSLRGNEETFLGSLAGNANLNLLVPDEDEA